MRKVNVVGGSGFIGSRLCQRLSQAGVPFRIVDKVASSFFPSETMIADVRDMEALRVAIDDGCVLVNLAAEHRDDVQPKSLYQAVNVEGARNLTAIAREKDVRVIVFTSSVAVYGFAPIGTDESGAINPFNDYGRTKFEAEQVFRMWQQEAPGDRTLVLIRPTVVFGERNRGNVYNLLRQVASGRFLMVGDGRNRKSIAYVENVAAFVEFSASLSRGVHVYNYVDKPDFTMNAFVSTIKRTLGRRVQVGPRLPFFVGYSIGKLFDFLALAVGKRFPISSIRVKKFCSDSVYEASYEKVGFVPPVSLHLALERTIRHEFIEDNAGQPEFYTE